MLASAAQLTSPHSLLQTPVKGASQAAPKTPATNASGHEPRSHSTPLSSLSTNASPCSLYCNPVSHSCQAFLQPPTAAQPSQRGCVLLPSALFSSLGVSLYQPVLVLCTGDDSELQRETQRLAYVCSAVSDTSSIGTHIVSAYPIVSVVVDATALLSFASAAPALAAVKQQRLVCPVIPTAAESQTIFAQPSKGLTSVSLLPLQCPPPSAALSARHPAAHHVELIITPRAASSTALSHNIAVRSAFSPQQWKERLSLLLRNRYVCAGCRIAVSELSADVTVSVCLPADTRHVLLVTASTTFTVHINTDAAASSIPTSLSSMDSSSLPSILAHPTAAINSLLSVILLPLLHASLFTRMCVSAPRGVLLHGSPGVGKTYAVRSICQHLHIRCFTLESAELWGGGVGAGEERLREVWHTAQQSATQQPTVLFIDEIDVLCPQRSTTASAVSSSSAERLTGQLLTLMDGWKGECGLLVLAATNHPHTVDAALRRPGRFDVEVELPPPATDERQRILQYYTRGMQLSSEVDLALLGERCVGYVGADLEAVCREAGLSALKRFMEQTGGQWRQAAIGDAERKYVTAADFEFALARIPASAQRNSLTYLPASSSPRYTFASLAGLSALLPRLNQFLTWPRLHSQTFRRLGLRPARGVLLYGAPGCGKTSIVRAIAGEYGYTLLTLDVSTVYSQYVGEGERVVREAFALARRNAPSILFIDELDAMVGSRDVGGAQSDLSVESRVLSTLLNEMDGIASASSDSPLLMAATNRLDALDAALTRPGRFDALLHVPLPDEQARADILRLHLRRMAMSDEADVVLLVERTSGWSGADLASLTREAGMAALRECIEAQQVEWRHFIRALDVVKPTTRETVTLGRSRG